MAKSPEGTAAPTSWSIDLPDQFEAAERIARRRGLSRSDIDALGVRSQALAKQAWNERRFDREVLPVSAPVVDKGDNATGEEQVVTRDQGLRDTPQTRWPRWRPSSRAASTPPAPRHRFPTARPRCCCSTPTAHSPRPAAARSDRLAVLVGAEPEFHLDGPVQATAKVLEKAGMKIADLDLFEINEAFASVVASWAGVHQPTWTKSTSTAGRSPWATRWVAPDRG